MWLRVQLDFDGMQRQHPVLMMHFSQYCIKYGLKMRMRHIQCTADTINIEMNCMVNSQDVYDDQKNWYGADIVYDYH